MVFDELTLLDLKFNESSTANDTTEFQWEWIGGKTESSESEPSETESRETESSETESNETASNGGVAVEDTDTEEQAEGSTAAVPARYGLRPCHDQSRSVGDRETSLNEDLGSHDESHGNDSQEEEIYDTIVVKSQVQTNLVEPSPENPDDSDVEMIHIPDGERLQAFVDTTEEVPRAARENQISYDQELAHATTGIEEPKTYKQAVHDANYGPEWRHAIEEELQTLEDMGTWRITELPPGRRNVKYKWVFKVKRNLDGIVERFKARLVAKVFS